jgi:hypothetical protein
MRFTLHPRRGSGKILMTLLFGGACLLPPPSWAKPRPALPPWPERSLALLRFDATNWWAVQRPAPVAFKNVAWAESWSGFALHLGGAPPRLLQYRAIESAGRTNLNFAAGALRFWFRPDWTSAGLGGAGPGSDARLLEAGQTTPLADASWWALYFSPDGDRLRFGGQVAGQGVDLLDAPIAWQAGEWHLVTLMYSDKFTALVVDDALAAQGEGVPPALTAAAQAANVFCIGSDALGENLAQGQFEELTTFGKPLTADEIARYYWFTVPTVQLGPLTPEEEQARRKLAQQAKLGTTAPEAAGFGESQSLLSGVNLACDVLWLEISASTSAAILTLHNTVANRTYEILSADDPGAANWAVETNFVALGEPTEVAVPMGQRAVLFFLAREDATANRPTNYYADTDRSFAGLNDLNAASFVPDTMGAVGPDHFVELLNNGIAVYDKCTGQLVERTNNANFFFVSYAGTNYPVGDLHDPRILYDHEARRWVACNLDLGPSQQVLLAVSRDASPLGLLTNWDKYVVPVGSGVGTIDYPTLGVDGNGIYLSVLQIHAVSGQHVNTGHAVAAIKKPEIYHGTFLCTVTNVGTNDLLSWTIQPAVNFDAVPANGYAWFVAKGAPDLGETYQGGAIRYGRMQWVGTNAQWADTEWLTVADSEPAYRNYYDLDGTGITAIPGGGILAPQSGGPGINLWLVGSRLMNAVIRDGVLWTCHHVGLTGANGAYSGDETGSSVDRSGIQWLKLRIASGNQSLVYDAHGRVFDSAEMNAWWYYFPSVMVNRVGDIALGFSGSSANDYVGAFCTWRLADGSMPAQPVLMQEGKAPYGAGGYSRWGDYSHTSLDPTDSLTFWTVQEYAEDFAPEDDEEWGTWIGRINRKP